MQDILEPYEKFDAWTQRTGILDGGGLTWVIRIPLNLLIVLGTFIFVFICYPVWYFVSGKKVVKNERDN